MSTTFYTMPATDVCHARRRVNGDDGRPVAPTLVAPAGTTAPGAGGAAGGVDVSDRLRRLIETQIIPRLMLVSRDEANLSAEQTRGASDVQHWMVVEFTDLLLEQRSDEIAELIRQLLDDGVKFSTVLLDLFAPSARRLGDLWETDERSFLEVTLAMGCLQGALRRLDVGSERADRDEEAKVGTVLLAPCSGEQHSFAIQILEVFFRRAGWFVQSEVSFDREAMVRFVSRTHMDVVGLAISRESLLEQLTRDIGALRRSSRNRSIVVLVGGRVFGGRPDLVERVGADATAEEAESAPRVASGLLPVRHMRVG